MIETLAQITLGIMMISFCVAMVSGAFWLIVQAWRDMLN